MIHSLCRPAPFAGLARPVTRSTQTLTLEFYTKYKTEDLADCMRDLLELHRKAKTNSLKA